MGQNKMDLTTAVGLLAAGIIPEAPVGLGRPAVPRTQYESHLRLIAALQEDRADQVERARRAEATVDYLQGCLAAVGAGGDLVDALRSFERENEQLWTQVRALTADLDEARRDLAAARVERAELLAAAERYITLLDAKWRLPRDGVAADKRWQQKEQRVRDRWRAARGEDEQADESEEA